MLFTPLNLVTTADAAIYSGIQIPVSDPLLLMSGMATVTEHLGFGVTCALTDYSGCYRLV
jgi:alkanesulfonate monooxygenase SsuD/methylene tetrahydromethanopterin reductase-like flavin-dependent oxidoreductase (luciferase family)